MNITPEQRLAGIADLHERIQPFPDLPGYAWCRECYTEGGTNVDWPCNTAWALGAHMDGVHDWQPADPDDTK